MKIFNGGALFFQKKILSNIIIEENSNFWDFRNFENVTAIRHFIETDKIIS